jgi:hypothetical protein
MLYSKQKIFCNACGKEFLEEFPRLIGNKFKVCSIDCLHEIEWRDIHSNMGKEYSERKK